jgi:hypothetical protein
VPGDADGDVTALAVDGTNAGPARRWHAHGGVIAVVCVADRREVVTGRDGVARELASESDAAQPQLGGHVECRDRGSAGSSG